MKTINIFENPLDAEQIASLNQMFGNAQDYENNMLQLWKLRSLIHKQLEKQEFQNPELSECFHTLNNLVGSLLPTHGTYYPGYGLTLHRKV